MSNFSWLRTLSTAALLCLTCSLAQAQATRTWVSGVGDDANPCSRTAPCKTFAGAISKTAPGGEISVLDPGGFGAVTITKSLTINGAATLGSILNASTNGVVINAGPSDIVNLRHLSISGVGSGLNGIRFLVGGQLIVEDVAIYGQTQVGIDVALTVPGQVSVKDSSISGGATGVKVNGTTGAVSVYLDHVSIKGTVTGVDALFGTTDVSNSIISQNSSFGVLAESTGTIDLEGNMLTNNGIAVQSMTGATVRLSNNDLFNNQTGLGCGGGTLASAGNNRKAGNVGGGSACPPNAVVALQ